MSGSIHVRIGQYSDRSIRGPFPPAEEENRQGAEYEQADGEGPDRQQDAGGDRAGAGVGEGDGMRIVHCHLTGTGAGNGGCGDKARKHIQLYQYSAG